jgi:hypothetical protein
MGHVPNAVRGCWISLSLRLRSWKSGPPMSPPLISGQNREPNHEGTSFTRKRPSRKPFWEHPPCERLTVPGLVACTCCGGARLFKLGEGVTER